MVEEISYSEEAVELIETLTSSGGGDRRVIAVPSCPTCKCPGAFYKLYGSKERNREVIVIE